ncbi:MAG: outer membrane protein assembly factor BamE [Deltaproteobacteria bacterium]|nr:outer membrane protein assembly factor BamE [Deltaproteobacteria bacterium]
MAPLRRGAAATVASFALLLTSACLTVGRPFPTDAVGQLQIGQTTRDEVHRIFGEPWRAGVEDGRRTWTYGHYRYKLFGTTETRDLVVRFDARGVVVSYTFNAAPPLDGAVDR